MKKTTSKLQLLFLMLFLNFISNAQVFTNGVFVGVGQNPDQANFQDFKFQVPVNSIFRGLTSFDNNIKVVTGKKLLWADNNWQLPPATFSPGIELVKYLGSDILKFSSYQNYNTTSPSGFDFVTDQNLSTFRIAQGRIGINTNIGGFLPSYTPKALLHISNGAPNFDGGILLDNNTLYARKFSITNTTLGNALFSINDVTPMASTTAINPPSSNNLMGDANDLTLANFKNYSRLVIDSQGNIGIGTIYPDKKLTVKGEIHAEGITIDLLVPADYVFEKYYTGNSTLKPEYKMPTLEEVEKFTKENNHLPEVPSAKEIREKGLNVGEMTNVLLQKIEELTLYSIELQKQLKSQNEEIQILKNNIK